MGEVDVPAEEPGAVKSGRGPRQAEMSVAY